MEALTLDRGRLSYRPDCDEPTPGPGEAVVEVLLAGICGTDLELLRGYAGFEGIPGHEVVGRIRQSDGHPEQEGRRVVVDINIGCGTCRRCRAGNRRHCAGRRVMGIRDCPGGFAARLAAPLENLIPVPETLSDEKAVFAEPLAAALEVLRHLPAGTDRVLVTGAGRLGQLVLRVLAADGRKVSAICRHESHRRLAAAAGATVLEAPEVAPESFQVVVDATGDPTGLEGALQAVRPGGVIVLKTTCAQPVPLDISRLVVNEVHLVGSRCGSPAQALSWLDGGRVDPLPLVEAILPLKRWEEAFERARRRGAGKVLFGFSGEGSA